MSYSPVTVPMAAPCGETDGSVRWIMVGRGMQDRRAGWRGMALVAGLALVTAACDEALGPGSADELDALSAHVAELGSEFLVASMPVLYADQSGTLDQLFHAALLKLAQEEGREAAREVRARFAPLYQAVQRAQQARDREAYLQALSALQSAQAVFIVGVFGDEVAHRVVAAATELHGRLSAKVAALKAAGTPVARYEAVLEQAASEIARARSLLAEGNAAGSLIAATHALHTLGLLRLRVPSPDPGAVVTMVPTLDELVALARARVEREHGTEAVQALFATLRGIEARIRAAREAGDRRALQQALDAAHAEKLRIVLRVFGDDAVVRVLDATARVADAVAERIEELEAAGRDVSRLEARLRDVARLHAAGTAALEAGESVRALDFALKAGGLVNALRRAVGR
jgi:hypothetical protein